LGLGWFITRWSGGQAVSQPASLSARSCCIAAGGREALLAGGQKNKIIYFIIFIFVTVWLLVYYGSWVVHDNISGHQTIGTSYLRYWLPSFILALPLISWLFVKILDFFKQRLSRILVGLFILGLMFVLSTQLVLFSEEGLAPTVKNIYGSQNLNLLAKEKLSADSIIISDRSDKSFWPEFAVATFLGDYSVFGRLGQIAETKPVYYYAFLALTDEGLAQLNDKLGADYGLKLEPFGNLQFGDMLYSLKIKGRN